LDNTRYEEMRQQCIVFHRANPEVWDLFVKFTQDRIRLGYANYSVNSIFERIRWETDQSKQTSKNQFKINNNHRPYYARRFMRMYDYDGFFRTRVQNSKNAPAMNMPELGPQDFQ